jgi:transcription-repair coupling factor (superfamily II helicase)
MRPKAHVDLIATIASSAAVRDLVAGLLAGRHAVATGAIGSSTALSAAAIARVADRPVLLMVAHLDDADEAADELADASVPTVHLPGLEVLPGETNVSVELFAERLAAVRAVLAPPAGGSVIIAPIQALMQAVPAPASLEKLSLVLARGGTHDLSDLTRWLDRAGYKRVDAAEEPGDFALRGGILDIFPAGGGRADGDGRPAAGGGPVRIDFFGDQIEKITEVDPDTMGSGRSLERVELVAANVDSMRDEGSVNFLELLPSG